MAGTIIERRGILALGLAVFAPATVAAADTFPSRPVRLIVPLAPASGTDILARQLGEMLSKSMGQQFIVDNKPGAGGVIGTSELARAAPDGYTLGIVSSNHVINPGVIKSIPFDTLRDITPISVLATVPLVLVVHPSLPVKNVSDLVAMARAKPGQLDYGSAGTGSAVHLAGVLFTKEAGVDMRHVPYRGTGPLINDLVAGHIKIGFAAASAVQSHVAAGTLRALAVSTPKRIPSLLDVPSMAEAGLPNYAFDAWIALVGPRNLPEPLVDRLHREAKAALESPKLTADLAAQSTTSLALNPAESARFFASELRKHQELVALSGAKPE